MLTSNNTDRLLKMGETLAVFHAANPSDNGAKYLNEWKSERVRLLRELSKKDGQSVQARLAMKAYRKQCQVMGIEPISSKASNSNNTFSVLGLGE